MRFLLIVSVSLLLNGCASLLQTAKLQPLTPQQQSALQSRQHALGPIDSWSFSGRLSIKTREEAWTGKVRWQQNAAKFRIHFNSPTGQGAVQLTSNPQFGVEMRVADGGVYYADDAETLLYNHTGWKLPVSGLRSWIIGLPEGNKEIAQLHFDEQGRIDAMEQYQWQIQYLDYQKVEQYDLPRKVVLQNDQLSLRIVIDLWNIAS